MPKLKFACLYKACGEYYRHLGFANALMSCGHSWYFWNPQAKSIYDLVDEYKPDVFIGTTFDLDRPTINCLRENPQIKVVLKGGNWGPNDDKIDQKKYPVLFITETEKILLSRLKEETGKPDFVFCHYHPNRVEETMSLWRNIGIEPIGIMNAADIIDYPTGEFDNVLKSDISFVGGYWQYKSVNLDKYILPLTKKYMNIKIFGNQGWPCNQFLGNIDTSQVKNLYKSSLVCPNVSEPHSNVFGFDVVERPFKILSSDGFLLMDTVSSAKDDVWGDSVPYYTDQKDFCDKIEYYVKNPEKRDWKKAREITLNEHTYHNRMAYLLERLGYIKESQELLEKHQCLISKL